MSLLTLSSLTASAGSASISRESIEAHLVASNVGKSMVVSEFMLMVCVPLSAEEHAAFVSTMAVTA